MSAEKIVSLIEFKKNEAVPTIPGFVWARPCVWSQRYEVVDCQEDCPLWEFSKGYSYWIDLGTGETSEVDPAMWSIYQNNNKDEISLCLDRKSTPQS